RAVAPFGTSLRLSCEHDDDLRSSAPSRLRDARTRRNSAARSGVPGPTAPWRFGQNRGMIVIQSAPWRRNLVLVLVLGSLLGFVISRFFTGFIHDASEHAAWTVGTIAVVLVILILSLRAAYPAVSFDPDSRTVRFGSKTVPVDSVHEA